MAEKGVVIEFDFAVLNGAELLFDTAKKFLKELDDIKLDTALEARYLTGNGYQDGLARLFAFVKTKKTAQKAARDLPEVFRAAVTAAVPSVFGASFKNFVKALTEKGVGVVFATRANVEKVKPRFEAAFGPEVILYQETSDCYGAARWDAWRRARFEAGIRHVSAVAIAGSGVSVKSALLAGMRSLAVVNDHVAYQDFGGANALLPELSGKTARKVLEALHVEV